MKEHSLFFQEVHQDRRSTRRLISDAVAAVPDKRVLSAKCAPSRMAAVSRSIGPD
jgi:hypothetical protein